jgi:hypothetical protein
MSSEGGAKRSYAAAASRRTIDIDRVTRCSVLRGLRAWFIAARVDLKRAGVEVGGGEVYVREVRMRHRLHIEARRRRANDI